MRHPRSRRRRRRQVGFTLVELMVSLVLFSLAIAGVLAVAVSMANGFREQRLAVGAESSSRAAMEFLSSAIRGASPGVRSGVIPEMYSSSGCPTPAAFLVTNSSSGPDELTLTFAYGAVLTSSMSAYSRSATSGTVDVQSAAELVAGDYIVITDVMADPVVAGMMKIESIAGDQLTVAGTVCDGIIESPASPAAITTGSLVIRVMRARFYIADLDGIPTLWMDPDADPATDNSEPLAEGIEDMQVAIGHDQDAPADGIDTENAAAGDADEWLHNNASDTTAFFVAGTPIRAVRISLVARATNQVTGVGAFTRPPLEDRPGSLAGDNYRRRVLRSTIEIRNLKDSP